MRLDYGGILVNLTETQIQKIYEIKSRVGRIIPAPAFITDSLEKRREYLDKRNGDIYKLNDRGLSRREIARCAGLSEEAVRHVLRRRKCR